MNTKFKVVQNGLTIDTVIAASGDEALRKAVADHGPDVQIEPDIDNDVKAMEGVADLRLMRSYHTKIFSDGLSNGHDQHRATIKEVNKWLSIHDIIIHSQESAYPEGNLTIIITYSIPAQTTVFKSVSERALANVNCLKEFFVVLSDENLFKMGIAFNANWATYPDREQTRRNCMNAIVDAIAGQGNKEVPKALIRAYRDVKHEGGLLTTSDLDLVKTGCQRFSVEDSLGQNMNMVERMDHRLKSDIENGVRTLNERWCEQVEFLLQLLAFYGINNPKETMEGLTK